MSLLEVSGVWKSYSRNPVLRGVELAIPARSIVAILGASGCGKTTLLRVIAGFDAVDAGRIVMNGTTLDGPREHVPAERRRIGYVPQEGSLFPHLTVAGNVAFGLDRAARRTGRVAEALQLTGLTGLERRYPHQISGGQQQRTALARALAPRPNLILMDEPFAALDLALRRSVCADVVALLRRSEATAILVTHDPQEAFASADIVMVMRAGQIVQCAAPETLYRMPVDAAVAQLTGAAILLDGHLSGARARTALGTLRVAAGPVPCGPVKVLIRPEQITAMPPGEGVPAHVIASAFHGDHSMITARVETTLLELRLATAVASGDILYLGVTGTCVAFPND